ncbi:hypothetical protein EJB05_43971, partial [Eragrostis curvula]
ERADPVRRRREPVVGAAVPTRFAPEPRLQCRLPVGFSRLPTTASSVIDGSSSSGLGGARRRSRLTEEIGRLAELLRRLPVEADRFDAERARGSRFPSGYCGNR